MQRQGEGSDPAKSGSADPADLERLAMSAFLLGKDEDSIDALTRAHAAFVAGGNPQRAVRSAFWIAFVLTSKRENARAGGWFARARRLLEECGQDCVECGYLLMPIALQQVGAGDLAAAEATFAEAAAIGARFGDSDLINLARQGRGRALLGLGQVPQGLALLDEVMVAVTSGDVSPVLTGLIYCSVISACVDVFDVRRAQEWTDALNHWCQSQPDVVPFRGECLVHRSELMVLHGAWGDATEEARRACDWLSRWSGQPVLGAALYQLGEILRLRGEFKDAEDAYRRAMEAGRAPYPGLALLRLAEGRADAAKMAISRVLDEAGDPRSRSRMLPAAVEILLATHESDRAGEAANELAAIAEALATPWLCAVAAHAAGAVALARQDPRTALSRLRDASATWRDLEAPYAAARTAVLIGLACRALGDEDSAALEFAAAARTFRELGATPDLVRVERLPGAAPVRAPHQLTPRELQVLQLLASGRTNKAIADALAISEKTVARHVSNIFDKLDLPSRAAATAYAFRHNLLAP